MASLSYSIMKITTVCVLCLVSIIPPVLATVSLECALGKAPASECPQDGGWTVWGPWGPCKGQCGSVGRQSRARNCSNPVPGEGGEDCTGHQREVTPCSVPGCTYEMYQTLLLGDSLKLLQLKILHDVSGSHSALVAQCIVSYCPFQTVSRTLGVAATEFWNALQCVKKDTGCPVAGEWGAWSQWTRCSARCGEGLQMRCRLCCDPPPSSQLMDCVGEPCEYQYCTGNDCVRGLMEEGIWSDWSQWSHCTAKCDFGITRRSRRCRKMTLHQKRKTFSTLKDKGALQSYDDADSYDSYLYDSYGPDKTNDDYKEEVAEKADSLWRIDKRSQDKCDTKVEYYSTEDDEEYPVTTVLSSKSLPTATLGKYPRPTESVKTHVPEPETSDNEAFKNDKSLKTTTVLKPKTVPTTFQTYMGSTSEITQTPQEEGSSKNTKTSTKTFTFLSDGDFESSSSHKTTDESTTLEIPTQEQRTNLNTEISTQNSELISDDDYESSIETTEESSTLKSNKKATRRVGIKTTKHSRGSKTRAIAKWRTEDILADDEGCDSAFGGGRDTTVYEETECTGELYKGKAIPEYEDESDESQSGHTTTKVAVPKKNKKTKKCSSTTTIEDVKCNTIKSQVGEHVSKKVSSTPGMRKTSSSKYSISTAQTKTTVDVGNSLNADEISSEKSQLSVSSINPSTPTTFLSQYSTTTTLSSSYTTKEMDYSTLQSSTAAEKVQAEEVETDDEEVIIGTEDMTFLTVKNCNVSNKLVLPSFRDNFEVDDCKGPFEQIQYCNIQPCSENGGWSNWSAWSACTPYCGLGHQISTRACTNPEPKSTGATCYGETSWRRSCFLKPCAVKMVTDRAIMTTGGSFIQYSALYHHQSLLHVYVRFRHFNGTGNLVSRGQDSDNRVRLSLYSCRALLSVSVESCRTNILSSKELSVGDWHDVMFTVVGAVVTMRVDDSVLPLRTRLTCRPQTPNYDADMKVGGHFLGEVDQLIVNFIQYSLRTTHSTKRDIWTDRVEGVKPSQGFGVQHELNIVELYTLSLAQFIQSPCFVNDSSWAIEVSIKPQLTSGLVLIVHGYGRSDLLSLTFEHSLLRLRVKIAGSVGECVQPLAVMPQTWIHLWLGKLAAERPIELIVNGEDRCVVNLAGINSTDQPSIKCVGSIYFGEVPLSLKNLLDPSEPTHSPLGLLGSLIVDRQRMDLERLTHKLGPDLVSAHPSSRYLFSSDTSSHTMYYEEVMVFPNQSLSLMCVYDLSGNDSHQNLYTHDHDLDTVEYSASWVKLDLPVETFFEKNQSEIKYKITDGGRSTRLDIYSYSARETVEGFYSCWLHYPLPMQPGVNIITYGVVILPSFKDRLGWKHYIHTVHIVFSAILLALFLLWLVLEVYWDIKNKCGLYRSGKLDVEKTHMGVHRLIFSDKGMAMLGGQRAADSAYERYQRFQVAESLGEDTSALDTTDEEEARLGLVKIDVLKPRAKRDNSLEEKLTAPVLPEDGITQSPTKKNPPPVLRDHSKKASSIYHSVVSLQELQESDPEDTRVRAGSEAGRSVDNLIDVAEEWREKEVRPGNIGHIQNTQAFRSIENELKFQPEKFQELRKYQIDSRSNK